MQPPSLEPIRLRMGRANHHAQELGREIGSFYATKPYEVVAEFDPEPEDPLMNVRNGAHIVRARVHHPIPTSVPLLAGETLQAMRSALDYVAWQLALARSESPPQTTAFPVFAAETLYSRDRLRFIGGIPPAIHPIFDSVQPYHAGDKATEHPLWVLHRLANDDKHKIPHVVASLPSGIQVERPEGFDVAVTMKIGPFEDDEIVGSYGIIGGADPETELHVGAFFGIAFGKDTPAQGRHLTDEIDRIGREVDAVIRKFEPFFPSP